MPSSALIQNFATQYGPQAVPVAQSLGLTPAEVLGQWGLETGWGTHFAGSNNLGNVSPGGQVGNYESLSSGIYAYQTTLQNMGVTNISNPSDFGSALANAGYATDPNYASKVTAATHAVEPYAPKTQSNSTMDSIMQTAGIISPYLKDMMGTGAGASPVVGAAAAGGTATGQQEKATLAAKLSNYGIVVFGALLILGALLISQRDNIQKVVQVGGKIAELGG